MKSECWFCREEEATHLDPLTMQGGYVDTKPSCCEPCASRRVVRAIFYRNYLRKRNAQNR